MLINRAIFPAIATALITGAGFTRAVATPSGSIYLFFIDANSDLAWIKSTDGGWNWSAASVIHTGTVQAIALYYDRWSGFAAGMIYIAITETVGHDVLFYSLNTESSDAVTGPVTIFAGASAAGGGTLSIARMRGGNLLCAFAIDAGTETGCYRSVDGGANWTVRANPMEGATQDQILILPGFAADDQDAIAIFWDASTEELERKIHDDSADSWAADQIAASMTDTVATTDFPHLSAIVDLTNSRIVLIAWSARDALNARLRAWAFAEGAITALTDVVAASTDDQGLASLQWDPDTGFLYAFYVGKTDGSETMNTAVKVYYKLSTDGGVTWGAETVLTSVARTRRNLISPMRWNGGPLVFSSVTDGAVIYYEQVQDLRAGGAGMNASLRMGL